MLTAPKPSARRSPGSMLTWGEAVEVHALRERGWSISAIANHLGRDRKTIRAYVNGEREPGRRRSQAPDPLVPFVDYLVARFADDPHVWASALYDEVARLGYRLSGGAAEAASSLWVPVIRSPHATCAYSWISPPSRSRRTTLPTGTTTAASLDPSGGACPKARCGRCTLGGTGSAAGRWSSCESCRSQQRMPPLPWAVLEAPSAS